jgi:hypothetical protein
MSSVSVTLGWIREIMGKVERLERENKKLRRENKELRKRQTWKPVLDGLPPEIIYHVHDYLYGDPKDHKARVLHEFKTKMINWRLDFTESREVMEMDGEEWEDEMIPFFFSVDYPFHEDEYATMSEIITYKMKPYGVGYRQNLDAPVKVLE